MKRPSVETAVGLFVLAGLLAIGYISFKFARMEIFGMEGYTVYAEFVKIGGLRPGAPVEIAGVEVGRVRRISLTEDYLARVEMTIYRDVRIQADAIASVKTKGLIGEKYIEITPGGSEEIVADGGILTETESAVDYEELISKFVFGKVE